eukprot:CAMPEP_0173398774 /NCGR_PEP_ID=MMETSP1356-20130122/42936_1 /TAXON_ID=77927 ORGANISM="Hemiselmis virescens, Strain PCC157" /NCGR_SAMPLE_ID=MMETSP1356 /ASSEMBLY_ACC=CAM_ASM_000847 /LENGTH=105 /DNA_ID=CAMNT_0014358355 /DNA_START=68 /DNA_END=385 /DNA_ORIENTATION=+
MGNRTIDNVVLQLYPPEQWTKTGRASLEEGAHTIKHAMTAGYEVRLMASSPVSKHPSWTTDHPDPAPIRDALGIRYYMLAEYEVRVLIRATEQCKCGTYLWFVKS